MVLGWISPRGHADPANADLDHAPQRRLHVLKTFHKNLKVKPVGGTRLIEIDYSNSDRDVAAAVVNKLSQALIDYSFRTRYDATQQASQWLSGQLGESRGKKAKKSASQSRQSAERDGCLQLGDG